LGDEVLGELFIHGAILSVQFDYIAELLETEIQATQAIDRQQFNVSTYTNLGSNRVQHVIRYNPVTRDVSRWVTHSPEWKSSMTYPKT
jgi:hypothetical protein